MIPDACPNLCQKEWVSSHMDHIFVFQSFGGGVWGRGARGNGGSSVKFVKSAMFAGSFWICGFEALNPYEGMEIMV